MFRSKLVLVFVLTFAYCWGTPVESKGLITVSQFLDQTELSTQDKEIISQDTSAHVRVAKNSLGQFQYMLVYANGQKRLVLTTLAKISASAAPSEQNISLDQTIDAQESETTQPAPSFMNSPIQIPNQETVDIVPTTLYLPSNVTTQKLEEIEESADHLQTPIFPQATIPKESAHLIELTESITPIFMSNGEDITLQSAVTKERPVLHPPSTNKVVEISLDPWVQNRAVFLAVPTLVMTGKILLVVLPQLLLIENVKVGDRFGKCLLRLSLLASIAGMLWLFKTKHFCQKYFLKTECMDTFEMRKENNGDISITQFGWLNRLLKAQTKNFPENTTFKFVTTKPWAEKWCKEMNKNLAALKDWKEITSADLLI